MLVKASIAAAALIAAAVSLSRVDYRATYDEMYPVNGLKRDVLGLCHQARPTFIRAVQTDRVGCYDSMPDAVDLAIGWVRTSDRLAALRRLPTPIDLAERVLAEAVIQGRLGVPELRRFTGYLAAPVAIHPCRANALALAVGSDPALGGSDESLARRIAQGGNGTLAALGLAAGGTGTASQHDAALPILLLDGAAPRRLPEGIGSGMPTASQEGCGAPA
jgi:hypothetical protein